MQVEQLIAFFESYIPLDSEVKKNLQTISQERNIKKKQLILNADDTCRHYSFVVSGLFKMYKVHKNGIEQIIEFVAENEWIVDLKSMHNKMPSEFYIEAIEPSVIIQIEKANIYQLFVQSQKIERIFRVIIENKYMQLENRVLQHISTNAEERYEKFLEDYPKISNRIPNTQIASYLGITPEFLSKIRNNLSKK
jgi:CRP-like cAMP-binding protein